MNEIPIPGRFRYVDTGLGNIAIYEGAKLLGYLETMEVFNLWKKSSSIEATEDTILKTLNEQAKDSSDPLLEESEIVFIGNLAGMSAQLSKELGRRGVKTVVTAPVSTICDEPERRFPWTLYPDLLYDQKKLWVIHGHFLTPAHFYLTRRLVIYNGSELRGGSAPNLIPSCVTTRDLLRYEGNASFFTRVANTEMFRVDPTLQKEKKDWKEDNGFDVVVGHFPSSRETKGSDIVDRVPGLLAKKGLKVAYLYQGEGAFLREQMPRVLNLCDYVIDQLNPRIGTYGLLSVEALLCGATPIASSDPGLVDDERMVEGVLSAFSASEAADIIHSGRRSLTSRELVESIYSPKAGVDRLLSILADWGLDS